MKLREEDLVELHAVFMQAFKGDAGPERPNGMEIDEWKCWRRLRGFRPDEAKQYFVDRVRELSVRIF